MKFSEIMGQQRVVNALQRAVSTQRVAHAYLFEGVCGSGRRSTAMALVGSLFCQNPLAGDACGICNQCLKLANGNHPDLHLLSPLPDKRDINIEQVRTLQQALALRPFEAPRKACLIEPAERMGLNAANALLKTLEEPSGNTIIILISSKSDLLLSTIRSRCQELRFSPLDDDTIITLLQKQGVTTELANNIAPLADGSIEKATEILSSENIAQRDKLLSTLAMLDKGKIATVFDSAENIAADRETTTARLEIIISFIRDMLLMTNGFKDIANRQLYNELTTEIVRFKPESLMTALELALESLDAIRKNANPKLTIERFLLHYAELRS